MKLDWKFDPMSLASSYKIVGDDAVSNKKKNLSSREPYRFTTLSWTQFSFTTDPTMATVTFSFSAKTLTLPYHPKTPISNFTPVTNLRLPPSIVTRTRNCNRIRAALDGDFSAKRSNNNEQRETIMLPGCDYNHWLIVMEFPKDPAPTREQMIDTYLDTLATVLGRFFSFLPLSLCFILE